MEDSEWFVADEKQTTDALQHVFTNYNTVKKNAVNMMKNNRENFNFEKMSQQFESKTQAVNVLLQGVQVAQKRGAYSLEEASVLSSAVTFLTTPDPEQVSEAQVPVEENTEEEAK